jgi:50S ribosome-binding GTPase
MNAPAFSERWNDELEAADFDQLVSQITRWVEQSPPWPPLKQATALWARVEPRLRELQNRLDRVLVVGVVGGSGTGKSTLVNALVGRCASAASDVQRPTTVRPVVVCHPDVDPSFLHFSLAGADKSNDGKPAVELVRADAPLLSAIILIDCPDPDTQGNGMEELANRNRDLLRQVLPQCDVMLHVATAQKYKTASVVEEILAHAPGRQIIFVQTHAAVDHDIRADWRRELESAGFSVPALFFIDSQEAVDRQQRGEPAPAELHALRDFLRTELAARARKRIRRANALDMTGRWIAQVRSSCEKLLPALAAFEQRIETEEARLAEQVRRRLSERLEANRQLWRAWLLERTTARWGNGPFAAFVRFVNRPFSPWRWLSPIRGRLLTGFSTPDRSLEGMPAAGGQAAISAAWPLADDVGIGAADLAESRSVLQQQADRAGLEHANAVSGAASRAADDANINVSTAGQLADQLGRQAAAAVEELVERRVARAAGPIFHGLLELLFLALASLLAARLAYNFFYEHMWLAKPLLGLNYLVYAALWLSVWGLILRWILGVRLQLGLRREIRNLVRNFDCRNAVAPLFSDRRQAAERIRRQLAALEPIAGLRDEIEARSADDKSMLGHRILPSPVAGEGRG